MDKFLSLKDDDAAEDEEGATRIRDEATVKDGEGAEAKEEEAAKRRT